MPKDRLGEALSASDEEKGSQFCSLPRTVSPGC